MNKSKYIIFHIPFQLNYTSKSASGIRPCKMIKAFEELGYVVDIVSGSSDERKIKIVEIINNIKKGRKYEFLYSESSTMPSGLTDKDHIPRAPFLDFKFFLFVKSKNIPISLFYRDIYWKFESYGENLSFHKKILAKFFYKFDLFCYNKCVDVLYLPSLEMKKYIPELKLNTVNVLPPAHSVEFKKNHKDISNPIKLLYVGGLSNHYKMHELFKAVNITDNVHLTICTRKNEWDLIKGEYEYYLNEKIKIVHIHGDALESLYEDSDICMIFVEPSEYWSFASPVKFYEYMGANKPIICSKGILIEKDVINNKIGWSVNYDFKELQILLNYLTDNKALIKECEEKLIEIFNENTWESRANKVIQDLAFLY